MGLIDDAAPGGFGRRFVLAGMGAGMAVAAAPALAREGPALPEAQGVSSAALVDLLSAFAASKHELHSLIVRRHGRDVARGWWSPYRHDVPQLLYSLSKSFTSTAVGMAVAEGKLRVTDRVVDFFPAQRPAEVSPHLAALTVRHLLTMSVGQATDSTPVITRATDWVRAFLALPIAQPPGANFLYNSGATYMLSAIVQKVTGQPVARYLRPRLFDPLGIADAPWATCPMGVNTGGWGLKATTDALAQFGQLYLQKGAWKGRQLLRPEWVAEATAAQIHQPLTGAPAGVDPQTLLQTSDWHQGYGYQFWRCRHDAFRGDGAFGQFCIVMPAQQAVVAITSSTLDMQGLLNLVWEHLLPGMRDAPLPPDRAAAGRLGDMLGALALPVPTGAASSQTAGRIAGRRFVLEPNAMGATGVTLGFDGAGATFALETAGKTSTVAAGMRRWRDGFTDMPGTPPEFTELIGSFNGAPGPVRVAAAAAWPDDRTLDMAWRYIETPHHDKVRCTIDGDSLRVEFRNSITGLAPIHAEPRPPLTGRLAGAA